MKPGLGEANLGALVGAAVGATGGLFAVGTAPAIMARSLVSLFEHPMLGIVCMFISGPIGWLVGGQIGPRFGGRLNTQRAEITGGVLGGMVPVALIALWGWWYVETH